MNNTCGKCGGYVGDFIYSGTGAVICNCTPSHKEEKCEHGLNKDGCSLCITGNTTETPSVYPTFSPDSREEWEKEIKEVISRYNGEILNKYQDEYLLVKGPGCEEILFPVLEKAMNDFINPTEDGNIRSFNLKVFISQVRQKAVKETLQFIALKEGWEESEEHYAKLLGIDLSDNK